MMFFVPPGKHSAAIYMIRLVEKVHNHSHLHVRWTCKRCFL